MKRIVLFIIAIGTIGWAVYEFSSSADHSNVSGDAVIKLFVASDDIGLDEGSMAPDFELSTMDGDLVKLSDYRGQRIILKFWGSWCPPCRVEAPDMQKLYEKHDVEILAVNLLETESHPDNVQQFIDEFGLTFPIPFDDQSDVSSEYQIYAYPTSLMIDSNGLIQSRFNGAINHDIMVQALESME